MVIPIRWNSGEMDSQLLAQRASLTPTPSVGSRPRQATQTPDSLGSRLTAMRASRSDRYRSDRCRKYGFTRLQEECASDPNQLKGVAQPAAVRQIADGAVRRVAAA